MDLGGTIIQAEVDKRYQKCFENGKIPDFIIHSPNSKKNFAIIEFKLASIKKKDIKKDFEKIVIFKINPDLLYSHGVEVLLGDKHSLDTRLGEINDWNTIGGEKIIVISFNTDSWKADHSFIQFKNENLR